MKKVVLVVGLFLMLPATQLSAQARWAIERQPSLDITDMAADGSVNFQRASGATRRLDGLLLIADRRAGVARWFDQTGKPGRVIGRLGKDPGEFSGSVMSLVACGRDSALVWDLRAERGTLVGLGGIGRQFTLGGTSVRPPLLEIHCNSSGDFAYLSDLEWDWTKSKPANPAVIATGDLVVVGRDSRVIDLRRGAVRSEWVPVVGPTGSHAQFNRPLGVDTYMALVGDTVVLGASDSGYLNVFRPNVAPTDIGSKRAAGRLGTANHIAVPVTGPAPTAGEYSAATMAIASSAPNQAWTDTVFAQLAPLPVPVTRPRFSGVFSDSDGLLWVQTSLLGSPRTDFLIMRLDGTIVARASLPMLISVYEVGKDHLVGAYTTENDVSHVALFKITRNR